MKLSTAVLLSATGSVGAFPSAALFGVPKTMMLLSSSSSSSPSLNMMKGLDTSGNSWKPDSEKMGSTDYGDYFPEGYDRNAISFTEGMMGSQELISGRDRGGPQLPGLENLGADAVVAGGINLNPDMPPDMQFIPSSVPDGEFRRNIASNGSGETITIEVPPICMTFEDYYAGFSADSFPGFSVSPATGRMDRRGGEPTILNVRCDPNGRAGELTANLVVNLPEDNSKISYKLIFTSF